MHQQNAICEGALGIVGSAVWLWWFCIVNLEVSWLFRISQTHLLCINTMQCMRLHFLLRVLWSWWFYIVNLEASWKFEENLTLADSFTMHQANTMDMVRTRTSARQHMQHSSNTLRHTPVVHQCGECWCNLNLKIISPGSRTRDFTVLGEVLANWTKQTSSLMKACTA